MRHVQVSLNSMPHRYEFADGGIPQTLHTVEALRQQTAAKRSYVCEVLLATQYMQCIMLGS